MNKPITANLKDWERAQKEHYNNRYAAQYQVHYDDIYSQKYRWVMICEPLFEGIEFSGKKVLEAMCGTGTATKYLLLKGAKVVGLDISPSMIEFFKKQWPKSEAICVSFFNNKIESNSFDVVVVLGALHHLHPKINQAIDEVYRILKPGGYFCFMEPHNQSLLDPFRRIWYKYDNLFEKNEYAINIDILERANGSRFKFIKKKYLGNIAYLFLFNSMVLRIPLWFKAFYAPLFIWLEKRFKFLHHKKLSGYAICQWRKI